MRVVATNLTFAFSGQPPLFSGLNFALEPGSLTAVVGPSGSGKSTLLSILAGFAAPTSGELDRQGTGRTGWVFQNPTGAARRSAADHVALPLLAKGMTRVAADDAALTILDTFALAGVARRDFRRLSGGEAQRLMLARAVALNPAILLVDEPTAQLDRNSAETVISVMAQTARAECVVIVATHDQRVAESCGTVLELEGA